MKEGKRRDHRHRKGGPMGP